MIKLFIFFILNASASAPDPIVLQVIRSNTQLCRAMSPPVCIKPINKKGTNIKAMEIALTGTQKVNILLYDKDGNPLNLEEGNLIQFKGDDNAFDADILIGHPKIENINGTTNNIKLPSKM